VRPKPAATSPNLKVMQHKVVEEQLHLAAINADSTNVEGTASTCCSRYRSRGVVLDIALGAGAVKSLVQNSQHTRSNPRS
jgi:hypothetical protein